MSEPQPLKLPEKSRALLADLYRAQQQAAREFQQAIGVALDFFGLDGTLNHGIDFATGIVTPAPSANGPTLVKEEAG